jgi:hypothetical protein
MPKIDRRQFIQTAALTAAGVMGGLPQAVLNANEPVQYADTIPSKEYIAKLGKHEKEVLRAFDEPVNILRFFIEEWHRRAHKTTLAINLLIRECCKYPNSKFVYVAPTQVWAREVVWDDPTMLWGSLPKKDIMDWKPNEQKMVIKFGNGSILKIGGSDKPDAWRGIDADGGVLDEWSLHHSETWTQIFRPIMAGPKKFDYSRERWMMFLYTPKGVNHATQMFNTAACIESEAKLPIRGQADKCKTGWFASRLVADESGIISRDELDKMLQEVAEGTLTQVEYDQEMQCRRVTDEERTLITSAMLDRLDAVEWRSLRDIADEIVRIVAIDPAFGGDICALKAFENGRELDKREEKNPNMRTNDIIVAAKELAAQIETDNFIVDCIGVGKGVADGLADDVADYNVQYFNSSEKVQDSDLYANKKAEAVAYAAQVIRKYECEPVHDAETRRQLVALSRYKVTNSGKMIMISNDDVKKELGCSPDKGLCWVYGQYGMQFVEPLRNESLVRYNEGMDDWRARKRDKRPQSAMT